MSLHTTDCQQDFRNETAAALAIVIVFVGTWLQAGQTGHVGHSMRCKGPWPQGLSLQQQSNVQFAITYVGVAGATIQRNVDAQNQLQIPEGVHHLCRWWPSMESGSEI